MKKVIRKIKEKMLKIRVKKKSSTMKVLSMIYTVHYRVKKMKKMRTTMKS